MAACLLVRPSVRNTSHRSTLRSCHDEVGLGKLRLKELSWRIWQHNLGALRPRPKSMAGPANCDAALPVAVSLWACAPMHEDLAVLH